jgi:hypothetical protein
MKNNNNYEVLINQDNYNKLDIYNKTLLVEVVGIIEDNMSSMTDKDVVLNGFDNVESIQNVINLDCYDGSTNKNDLQKILNDLNDYIEIIKSDEQ